MAELKPLFARVVLKREVLKSSSIIITDAASLRNAPTRGECIAKGPTADESIQEGKTYIFGKHAGVWLNTAGKPVDKVEEAEFFVCNDEDLICEVSA